MTRPSEQVRRLEALYMGGEPDLGPHIRALQTLADQLAGMTTDDEMAPDGMSGDDAAQTLSTMIESARRLSDCRPASVNLGDDSR